MLCITNIFNFIRSIYMFNAMLNNCNGEQQLKKGSQLNPLFHFQKYQLAPKTFGYRHQGDPPAKIEHQFAGEFGLRGVPLMRKAEVFGANQVYFWLDKMK